MRAAVGCLSEGHGSCQPNCPPICRRWFGPQSTQVRFGCPLRPRADELFEFDRHAWFFELLDACNNRRVDNAVLLSLADELDGLAMACLTQREPIVDQHRGVHGPGLARYAKTAPDQPTLYAYLAICAQNRRRTGFSLGRELKTLRAAIPSKLDAWWRTSPFTHRAVIEAADTPVYRSLQLQPTAFAAAVKNALERVRPGRLLTREFDLLALKLLLSFDDVSSTGIYSTDPITGERSGGVLKLIAAVGDRYSFEWKDWGTRDQPRRLEKALQSPEWAARCEARNATNRRLTKSIVPRG
jgi:hypothetical protein